MERLLSFQIKVGEPIYILSKDGTLTEEIVKYIKIIENDEKIYYNAKNEIICKDNDIEARPVINHKIYLPNKHLANIFQKQTFEGKCIYWTYPNEERNAQ